MKQTSILAALPASLPASAVAAACLFLGALSGCSDQGEDVTENQAPIYDADGDAWPDNGAHPQVTFALGKGSGGACTYWLAASHVLVTAAHCVVEGEQVPDDALGPVVLASNASGAAADGLFNFNAVSDDALIAMHPSYQDGFTGVDLAVVVYPTEASISRKALLPMKVAYRDEEPDDTPILLGGGLTGEDCDGGSIGSINALKLETGLGTGGGGYPQVEFDFDESTACSGDSGGAIISLQTQEVLAGNKGTGGDGGDDVIGPALWMENGVARNWLHESALDRDGDDIESFEDNCDIAPNPSQADFDQDGVGDPCDLCPYDANDQIDGDADGVPDCADPCDSDPVDPARPCQGDDIGDSDCDGVCDSIDTCPYRKNDQNLNTNDLSEQFLGADVVGDDCEPVPVPDGGAGEPLVIAEYSFDGSILAQVFRHVVRDQIAVRPQPSRNAPDNPAQSPPLVPSQPIATHFRFCQDDPAASNGCTDFENLGDAQLHLGIQATDETPGMRYHRVKMGFSVERGATLQLTYNGTETFSTWFYAADGAFWTNPANFNPPLIDLPPPEQATIPGQQQPYLAGAYSGMAGTFWLHGATTIGHPGNDIGTGEHGGGAAAGEELSNHYFAIDPEEIEYSSHTKPQQERFFFLRLTLPDPVLWREDILDLVAHESLVLVDTVANEWGVMNPDGTAQIATEHLSNDLRASLEDSTLVWASASEPFFHIGGSDAPVAVAVSADGNTVAQVATKSQDGQSFEGQIQGGQHLAARAARAAAEPFALALSRLHRSVYRVGPGGGISRAAIDRDGVRPWLPMATALPVGTPLAALVSFRDRGLYVLDQVERDRKQTIRLLRYDALRGGGIELGSFTRSPDADQIWLELDRDGQLLVAMSSAGRGRHAVFRLEVEDRQLRAVSWQQGDRALAYPPLVDGAGYVFYRRVGERLEGARSPALSLQSCALSQLAAPF